MPPMMAPRLATPTNGDRAARDFVSLTGASTAGTGGAGVWAGVSLAIHSMDSCSGDRFSSTNCCMATLVPSQPGRQLHPIALSLLTKTEGCPTGTALCWARAKSRRESEMGRATVLTTIAIYLATAPLTAQPQAQAPRFEVASVRLVPDSEQFLAPSQRLTNARVDIRAQLIWLLFWAFRAQYYEFQISAPNWVSDVRVDIQATMPPGATVAHVPEMLQRLLAERFGMVVHRETRQVDGYELIVGPEGIRMQEVEPVNDLATAFPPQMDRNGGTLSDTTRETPDGTLRTISIPGGTRRITSRTMYDRIQNIDTGFAPTFNATRMTMTELAPLLWETMDAPVVDKTGLTGVYQFTLTLPRGAMTARLTETAITRLRASAATDPARAAPSAPAPNQSTTPSALKAIESLGLRLERRRVPLEVVVVDKISRTPTEN